MKFNNIRILLTGMLLVVVMGLPQFSKAQNSMQPEGTGSKEDPFIIRTAENLAWFRDWVNGSYTVDEGKPITHFDACAKIADNVSEIDMTNVCHAKDEANNIGELSWVPIGNYISSVTGEENDLEWNGTFDGNGKTITNLYINNPRYDYQGLFGAVVSGASICKLTIRNANIINNGYAYSGIVAGYASNASFQEIKIDNSSLIGGSRIGGIIGFANNVKINNCQNYATVIGTKYVGGICGFGDNQSCFLKCQNFGNVSNASNNTDNSDFGSIAGHIRSSSIEDCANYAIVSGVGNVGGLIGESYQGKLKNLFNYGDVSGKPSYNASNHVGLAIGYAHNQTTFEGIIAFNQDATLMYDDQLVEDDLIGCIDEDSQTELVKGYSEEEIASGKVTYLLNNSTSEGALKWYQKLGDDGDQYPMLQSAGDDIVYYGNWCTNEELYTNDNSVFDDKRLAHKKHEMATNPDSQTGLYSYVCPDCNNASQSIKFVKDFCGIAGNNLRLTYDKGKYNAETVTLTDGEAYNSPVDIEVTDFKYARTYAADKWQPLYVPFAMNVEQWTGKGLTVASINNFHEVKLKSGDTQVLLEVKKVTSGSLEPNIPYLILCDTEGENLLELGTTTLSKAEEGSIDCHSVTRNYVFQGKYTKKSGFDADQETAIFYGVKDGEMVQLTAEDEIGPQNWYLTITNRPNLYDIDTPLTSAAKTFSIRVVGDGEATGIEDIHVISDKGESGKQGIFDLQGRQLNAEPTHGIYIKNGKKYVK